MRFIYSKGIRAGSFWPVCTVVLTIGVFSGLTGMLLNFLLHGIERLAYTYTTHFSQSESFLQGIQSTTPLRRIMALTVCGIVAGLGWYLVAHRGSKLVSIHDAVHMTRPRMPFWTSLCNALLQVITVALGSPLGREVAPREIAAAFACWLSEKMALDSETAQMMVACAAGAGLAAVYNVPLGGALFVIEVLWQRFQPTLVLYALTTSAIATAISWIGLGSASQYTLGAVSFNLSFIVWALCAGPLFGLTAHYFNRWLQWQKSFLIYRPGNIIACVLHFMMIGVLAIYFPALLGNGKDPVQLGFSDLLTSSMAFILLGLRIVIVGTSLRFGAKGGVLTPSLANGVLLAAGLGGIWNSIFQNFPLDVASCSVVGGAAFLAVVHNMPLTAIVLVVEFTSIPFHFLVPVILAVAGSMAMARYLSTDV